MAHRSSAGPTLRPFGYRFVEWRITSASVLQMDLSPPRADVQVDPGVCSGVRFCDWWDLQGSRDVAITWSDIAAWCSLGIVVRTFSLLFSATDTRKVLQT
jgi:hypothetical protein